MLPRDHANVAEKDQRYLPTVDLPTRADYVYTHPPPQRRIGTVHKVKSGDEKGDTRRNPFAEFRDIMGIKSFAMFFVSRDRLELPIVFSIPYRIPSPMGYHQYGTSATTHAGLAKS